MGLRSTELDSSGYSVSNAGDINNDGFDDIMIGAPRAEVYNAGHVGETYVVFGKASGFSASLDLSSLDGTNGFKMNGINTYNRAGSTLSSAGDMNGDGYDDIIIGAQHWSATGASGSGDSYVVFGKESGFLASMDLFSLDGTNGFRFSAPYTVSSAGDINGDGYDDIILGATHADPSGKSNAGQSYVMFGKASGFSASYDSLSLDGTNGFKLNGVDAGDYSGSSVSSVGDFNGDGYDDIIIGSYQENYGTGKSYIMYGYDNNSSQSVTHDGDSDNEVISGSAVNDTLNGAGGNDIIHGGNGNDKITGGDGNDKLNGGYGNDEFIFNNGFDSDIILDFEDGKDKINLSSYQIGGAEVDDVLDFAIQQQGGDVLITGLTGNDEILIRNADASSFTNDDFIF